MADKFHRFAALHVPGNPLILYNAWDVGSALAVAKAGAKAVATGSAAVAAAHGYGDSEDLPLDLVLANAARIVSAVALPVSIDFEGGYAADPATVAFNAQRLVATGAIGCNFEDRIVGEEALHSIEFQSRRIAAIRKAVGPAFFINARTDIFLKAVPDEHDAALIDAATGRANAYADAGASGFFAPGLVDALLIARLCKHTGLPVNIMEFPGVPSPKALADAGVARISYGASPYRNAMAALVEAAQMEFSWR